MPESSEPAAPRPGSDTITTRRLARSQWLIPTPRTNMAVIGVSYAVFALSLLFQPARWGATPAYRNLLEILPQQAWGGCFAVTSILLGAAMWQYRHRWLSGVALSCALAITTTWFAAFMIRWLTSASTTPETWVSWAVFDFLLFRALMLLGYGEVRVPGRRSDSD